MGSLLVGQKVRNSVVKFFLRAYRFAPESTTLGREDKRVKQILRVPIDDNGEEDLFSHLSDIVNFIGKKRYFHYCDSGIFFQFHSLATLGARGDFFFPNSCAYG